VGRIRRGEWEMGRLGEKAMGVFEINFVKRK
jgi:hypothetical protein